MSLVSRIWGSSLGKKYIMAVTGCILLLFVVAHMLGNLMVFVSPSVLNEYGNFLQSTPEVLWPTRITLVVCLVLHFVSSAQLTLENRSARGVGYNAYQVVASSWMARTMIISGFIVLFFVVYHLLHFTVETPGVNLTGKDFRSFTYMEGAKERHDIYRMVVMGFNQPVVAIFYIIGVGLLCAHLAHGFSSMFQSVGWRSVYYRKWLERGGKIFAVLLFAGYCSVPLAVLLGWLSISPTTTAGLQTPTEGAPGVQVSQQVSREAR
jgi:succinate dehydrogenase / fumarate reductase, cytochrome b subunit